MKVTQWKEDTKICPQSAYCFQSDHNWETLKRCFFSYFLLLLLLMKLPKRFFVELVNRTKDPIQDLQSFLHSKSAPCVPYYQHSDIFQDNGHSVYTESENTRSHRVKRQWTKYSLKMKCHPSNGKLPNFKTGLWVRVDDGGTFTILFNDAVRPCSQKSAAKGIPNKTYNRSIISISWHHPPTRDALETPWLLSVRRPNVSGQFQLQWFAFKVFKVSAYTIF